MNKPSTKFMLNQEQQNCKNLLLAGLEKYLLLSTLFSCVSYHLNENLQAVLQCPTIHFIAKSTNYARMNMRSLGKLDPSLYHEVELRLCRTYFTTSQNETTIPTEGPTRPTRGPTPVNSPFIPPPLFKPKYKCVCQVEKISPYTFSSKSFIPFCQREGQRFILVETQVQKVNRYLQTSFSVCVVVIFNARTGSFCNFRRKTSSQNT